MVAEQELDRLLTSMTPQERGLLAATNDQARVALERLNLPAEKPSPPIKGGDTEFSLITNGQVS